MPKLSGIPRQHHKVYHQKKDWLPIDERILPNLFRFSHVHGIARIFLEFEIAAALVTVTITLVATVLKLINLQ